MSKIRMLISSNIIKSFYYSSLCFGVNNAIKFPLLIGYKCYIKGLSRKTFEYEGVPTFGFFRFGVFQGSFLQGKHCCSSLILENDSLLKIGENVQFSKKSFIKVSSNAKLLIEKNFSANSGLVIKCSKEITIKEDANIGWDVTILDDDGHDVFVSATKKEKLLPIYIGKHVWLGAKSSILKGTYIDDDCVVGFGCVANKSFKNCTNSLLVGFPASVKKDKVTWVK